MLRNLDIRDMLIIDRLELEFQPDLNVLTGETGAGKSILLDALGFVLGWRGRAELVRVGAEQGEVSAVFDLPEGHAAQDVLRKAGLPEADELILRRTNTRDGRKTAYINDRRASGEVLRTLSDCLVELHGQQDDRGLLNPRGHRALLDVFAGSAPLLEKTRATWRELGVVRKRLTAAEAALAEVKAEEEFLRYAVGELDALDPKPGEEGNLDQSRRLMQTAVRICDDIAKAHAALGYGGAEGSMRNALRWLEDVADRVEGRLDGPIAAIGWALNKLGDAEQGVSACIDAMSFNPSELEAVEERLFAIRALARKHGVTPDDLGCFAATLRDKLDALEGGTADIVTLTDAVGKAAAAYAAAADRLTTTRKEAAGGLDVAMAAELAPLKIKGAVFLTEIDGADPGPEGHDAVAFTVTTNPGTPAGPLNKIASGGELSRFLLALKVCLTAGTRGITMIFDEIDRGVGGATADAVGRRLAALAQGAQILVVTHSPQVAAQGQHHWQVTKRVANDVTLSTVIPLAGPDRIDEIARMLAGDTITDEARGAARALLAG